MFITLYIQSVMEYEEHEKRAWSVDFSRTDPSMLVSGSDDCKVIQYCKCYLCITTTITSSYASWHVNY